MTIAERFEKRFHGLSRAHGTYKVNARDIKRGKMTGKASTLKEEVTVAKWESHLRGEVGLGIVPINDESVCRFGAIDVDDYSLNLEALEKRVSEAEFPLVVCRTKSGGAHLYAFFSEPVPAGVVKDRLMEWAISLGYPNSEVFPKQAELRGIEDVGSWINMPYFGSEQTTRYGIRGGAAMSPLEFLDFADATAVTAEAFSEFVVKQDARLDGSPPCLQYLAQDGFPEGTRNRALFNLGVFCRLRHGDEWKLKMDEFNRVYLIPPLSSSEVKIITGSLSKKTYFYTCKEPPIVDACNRAICVRRKYGIGGSSNDPGVVMDGLVKILTDPPTWLLNVDGHRIKLETTDDLLNQSRFTRMCIEVFNVLPQRVTRPVWDDLVRGLLEKVEEVDAPQDASSVGQFMFLVEQFCTERPPARDKEELLLGKPYADESYLYFRSPDMLAYMEKRKLRISAKDAWNILRDLKAKTKQFKVKGRCVRCWGIPSVEKQNAPFAVPEVPSNEEF